LLFVLADRCRERSQSPEDVVGYGEGDGPLGRNGFVKVDNIVLS